MKYNLRSLLIVVTLICVAVGGRVEYLRRMAAYHEREAKRRFNDLDTTTANSRIEKFRDTIRAFDHQLLAEAYRKAVYRPWTFVNEEQIEVQDFPFDQAGVNP